MKEMRTQQCQLSKIAYLVTDKIPMEDGSAHKLRYNGFVASE